MLQPCRVTKISRLQGFIIVGVCVLISAACVPASSSTDVSVRGELIDRVEVTQFVVRYQPGAPPDTFDGRPWGIQCVSTEYQADLSPGPSIGAQMKVVSIDPPVLPIVAQLIALEMQQCPYIDWAEADVVRFDVPSAQDLDPAPTLSAVSDR